MPRQSFGLLYLAGCLEWGGVEVKGNGMWREALESFFSCPEMELSCGTHRWHISARGHASIGSPRASALRLN